MITQPYPSFIDPEVGGRAKPVSNGTIFIGQNQKDAIQFPEKVYYTDSNGIEIEMDQPIHLNSAGVTVASKNSSTIVSPYTKSTSYSILIRNSGGNDRYANDSVSGYATSKDVANSSGYPWLEGEISVKDRIYNYQPSYGPVIKVYDPAGGNILGDEPDFDVFVYYKSASISIFDSGEAIDPFGLMPSDVGINRFIQKLKSQKVGEDSHGATINFPRGDFLIDNPIILPRSSTIPRYIINIAGEGLLQTRFVQSGAFPSGRAAFEWEDGNEPVNFQELSGFTVKLANKHDVKAIHYAQPLKSTLQEMLDNTFRDFILKDIYVLGSCEYHSELIKLEGNVKYGKIDNITADCTPKNWAQDPIILRFDFDEFPNDDGSGIHYSSISNIYGALRRGGFHQILKGRFHRCDLQTLHNTNGNRGAVSYEFINSDTVTGSEWINEGKGGKQYLFNNCKGFQINGIGFGTPSDQGSGFGDGVTFSSCRNFNIKGQSRRSGNPTFSSLGVKMMVIDSNCHSVNFSDFDVNTSLSSEVQIDAAHNNGCGGTAYNISAGRNEAIGSIILPDIITPSINKGTFKFKSNGATSIDASVNDNHIINDSSPTTLSNIENGNIGQTVTLLFRTGNTTVNESGNIRIKNSPVTIGQFSVIDFLFDGTNWYAKETR